MFPELNIMQYRIVLDQGWSEQKEDLKQGYNTRIQYMFVLPQPPVSFLLQPVSSLWWLGRTQSP